MPLPEPTPANPPSRPTRHIRTISHRTLDGIIETAFPNPPSSRPSTASTTPSFTTAFSALETSSLPRSHAPLDSTPTPTPTSPACDLSLQNGGIRIEQVGRFYRPIPGGSTERSDACDAGFDVVDLTQCRSACGSAALCEQRAVEGVKDTSSVEVEAGTGFSCRPGVVMTGGCDLARCTVGERLDLRGAGSLVGGVKVEKVRRRVRKDRYGKRETVLGVSERIKKVLRRCCFGEK